MTTEPTFLGEDGLVHRTYVDELMYRDFNPGDMSGFSSYLRMQVCNLVTVKSGYSADDVQLEADAGPATCFACLSNPELEPDPPCLDCNGYGHSVNGAGAGDSTRSSCGGSGSALDARMRAR